MAAGMLLTVPSNLVAGALPRTRPLWTRGKGAELPPCWPGSSGSWSRSSRREACWRSPSPTSPRRWLPRLSFDDRCSAAVSVSARRRVAAFMALDCSASFAGLFRSRWPAPPSWRLLNLPVLLVSAFVSDRVAVAQWGLTRVVAGPASCALRPDDACRWRPNSATIMRSANATAAKPVRPRIGAGDAAGERRGLRAVAVLAGFLRALDPWHRSLRSAC